MVCWQHIMVRSLRVAALRPCRMVRSHGYSEFEGLSFPQAWQKTDGLPFWAIPLDPPTGYYQTADASNGTVSTDIGLKETGATPVGHSLQLTGSGRRASEFQWTGPLAATRGQVNAEQEFRPTD